MTVLLEMLPEGPGPSPGPGAPQVRGTQTSLTCVPGRGVARRASPWAGRGAGQGLTTRLPAGGAGRCVVDVAAAGACAFGGHFGGGDAQRRALAGIFVVFSEQ